MRNLWYLEGGDGGDGGDPGEDYSGPNMDVPEGQQDTGTMGDAGAAGAGG